MGVMRISAHSFTNDVGIGSRSQDLDGEDYTILSRSSSDTGVKEDSIFSGVGLFIYLWFRFQYCTGHITTGSWKGNQYI